MPLGHRRSGGRGAVSRPFPLLGLGRKRGDDVAEGEQPLIDVNALRWDARTQNAAGVSDITPMQAGHASHGALVGQGTHLLEALAFGLGALGTLAAREVHEVQLGGNVLPCHGLLAARLAPRLEVDGEELLQALSQ